MIDKLLTPKEAAEIISVHRASIYRWIREGYLKSYKIEGNIRIKEQDLEDMMVEVKV